MGERCDLGWCIDFTPPQWEAVWAVPDVATGANGRFDVDVERSLERACFDFWLS
jgi:hypothetical protein